MSQGKRTESEAGGRAGGGRLQPVEDFGNLGSAWLGWLLLATAAAGAAVAVGHVTLAQADDKSPVERDKQAVNYRETDHIRAYYASLRD